MAGTVDWNPYWMEHRYTYSDANSMQPLTDSIYVKGGDKLNQYTAYTYKKENDIQYTTKTTFILYSSGWELWRVLEEGYNAQGLQVMEATTYGTKKSDQWRREYDSEGRLLRYEHISVTKDNEWDTQNSCGQVYYYSDHSDKANENDVQARQMLEKKNQCTMSNPYLIGSTIQCDVNGAFEVLVFDLMGRLVLSQVAENASFRLEKNFDAGMYFLNILQENKILVIKKMVME